jgi:hypothetical protein
MANEVAVSGKSEVINAFVDKITTAINIVKSGQGAVGDARPDQAQDQGRRRLRPRHGRQIREARPRRRLGLRAGGFGGRGAISWRRRPPADRRASCRHWFMLSVKAAAICRRKIAMHARRRGGRLSL